MEHTYHGEVISERPYTERVETRFLNCRPSSAHTTHANSILTPEEQDLGNDGLALFWAALK